MNLQLKGKTALVTGASTGIGRAIAAALAAEGVQLCIVARRKALLEELAREIAAAGGSCPGIIEMDMMPEGAPARLARAALDALGRIDILMNSAGGSKPALPVDAPEAGRIMSEQIRRKYSPEFRAKQSAEEIPVGRYGEPEELACLAVFLASPIARYITGSVLPVDGGLRRYAF